MPKRICDSCGKEKDIKGGKVCANGHFICRADINLGMFGPTRTKCPIDDSKLR